MLVLSNSIVSTGQGGGHAACAQQ